MDIAVNGDLDLLGADTIETTTRIRLATTNDFALSQNLKSTDITIHSGNNVTVEGAALEASNAINVVADKGNLNLISGSMKATNKLELASNEKDINITSLSLDANEAKLSALKGKISQGSAARSGLTMLAGQSLRAEALKGIALDNQYNDLSKVVLKNNAAGDILFTNGGNKGVEVNLVSTGTINGNVKVHNAANGSVNTLKVNRAVNATGFVDIANYEGSIILGGDGSAVDVTSITGKSVSILAKDALSNNISLTATNGELKLESLTGSIYNSNGSLNAGAAGVAGNGGSITLVATNGSIVNSQELNARDNITLKALSDIAVTKKLTAGKDIQVVSSGKVSINNFDNSIETGNITLENAAAVANAVKSVESLNGSVTITGGAGVENDGFIKAKGDVVLTSTGASANVDNKRSIWSTDGNLVISSQNNINNAHSIVAQNGGISFTAANNISSNGENSYLAASKSVAMTATAGNIANKSVLKVADSVTMLAGGYLTTNGNITAGKAVSLKSGTELSAGKIVSNNSTVTVNAGGSAQLSGGVSAKEDVTLTADGAFNSNGGISGKNVTITAGSGDLTNAAGVTASGMASLTANAGSIINNGSLSAAGGIVLTAKASESVAQSGSVTNSNDISATSGNVTITADKDISTGTITAGQGNIVLEAKAGKITNGGAISAQNGEISFEAYTYLITNGSITAGNAVTFKAGSALNASSITAGNSVTLKAGTDLSTGRIVSNNSFVNITAAGAINTSGGISAKENVTVHAGGSLSNSGEIRVKDVTISAGTGDLTNAYGITASGLTRLTASVGSIINSGNLTAGTGITLTASAGSITNSNSIIADKGNIILSAGTTITNALADNAGDNSIKIHAKSGDISLIATGNVNSEAITNNAILAVNNGTITLKAKNGNIANTGTGKILAGGTSETESYAGNIIMRADNGSISNAVALAAKHDITLISSADIANNMGILAGENVYLHSTAGDISNTTEGKDIISVGGTVTLEGVDITNRNNITAASGVYLYGTGAVNNSGTIKLEKTEKVPVTNNAQEGSTNTQERYVQVVGTGDIVLRSVIYNEQGNVIDGNNCDNRTVINTGTITTKGNIILEAEGNVTNGQDGSATASLISNGGMIKLHSYKKDVFNYDILGTENTAEQANANIALVADEGSITNTQSLNASGFIALSAKNDIANAKDITAGSYVSIVSTAGSVSNTGKIITTAGDIVLDAKTTVANSGNGKLHTFDGNISLIAAGDNLVDNVAAVTNNATLAVNNGTITLKATNGNIENADAGKVLAGEASDINNNIAGFSLTNAEGITSQTESYAGSIIMCADNGSIINEEALVARHDITLISSAAIANDKGILAGGNIYLKSTAGDITNSTEDKNIVSLGGTAILEGTNITNNNNITAASGVYLYGTGTVYNSGTINLEKTEKVIVTNNLQEGATNPQEQYVKVVGTGDIVLRSVTYAKQTTEFGEIDVVAGGGTVTNSGSITAKGNITLEAWGDVTNGQNASAPASLISNGGMIKLHSYKVNVINYSALGTENATDKANASIALLAEKGSITNENTLNASGFVALVASSINNTQRIDAGSFVSVDATLGDISNSGYISAGTGVLVTSHTGSVKNEGNIISAYGDIVLDAERKVENTNNGQLHASDGDISLIAAGQGLTTGDSAVKNDATLLVNNGIITLEAEHGNVVNTASGLILAGDAQGSSSVAGAGSISMIARDGAIINSTGLGAKQNITLISSVDINNTMDILAGGNIRLEATGGNVNNTTTNKKITSVNGSVTIIGKDITNSSNISAGSNVTVNSSGNVSNSGNINAVGDVGLEAKGSITNSGDITSSKDVNLGADNSVNNSGSINAVGEAKLQGNNSVANSGSISTGSGASLISRAGAVSNSKAITVEKGNILLQADQTVVNTDSGMLQAENGDVKLFAAGNNVAVGGAAVTNSANLKVNNGAIILEAMNGNVINTSTGNLLAGNADGSGEGGSISLIAHEGAIENSDTLVAKNNITLLSSAGISNANSFLAGGDISIEATAGGFVGYNEHFINSRQGSITIKANTNINNDSSINAAKDIKLYANEDITSNNTLNAGNRLDASSMDGAISLSQGATAGQGGMFIVSGDLKDENTTKGGDITINGDLLVNNSSTSAGDIVVFTSNGNIKLDKATINDGDDSLIRLYSAAGNINANTLLATAGSVDVGAKTGNININDIDAAWLASTGTSAQGGNIVLGTIKGNAVVLYTENGNSSIKADSVVAKKYIALQGNKIDAPIDKENSGVEALIMDIRGTSGKKTLPNVILSFAGNKDYNCEYNDERMLVEYQGYKTSIYGSDPKFDGSNAIYYAYSEAQAGGAGSGTGLDLSKLFFQYDDKMAIIEELRKAVNSVKPGTAGAEGFLKSAIYLHYDSANRQRSNALLLHLDNYFYVYGQRKSAEDLGRKLLDEKTSLLFANYYQPKLFDYNRVELVVDESKAISSLSQEEDDDLQLRSSEDGLELN